MGNIRFAIVGYGRMGKLVEQVLSERNEQVQAIVDPNEGRPWDRDSLNNVDSAICFTSPDAGYETTKRILERGVDAVVATTKFYLNKDGSINQEMLDEFAMIARQNDSRMMYASNLCIGMNAFLKHLKLLAETMAKLGYDPAVEERHHNKKADIAGTAKTIGNILISAYRGRRMNFGDLERKRKEDEITVSSTRVGYVPGTHTVIFDSSVDTIEFIHRVRDPKIFAHGAIDSAYWLREQKPGVYSITERLI